MPTGSDTPSPSVPDDQMLCVEDAAKILTSLFHMLLSWRTQARLAYPQSDAA
jgi:hypothetical protein